MDALEGVLIAAMHAKDSQGRHVRLISFSDHSPKTIAAAAQRTLDQLATPSPDPAIEANRRINRRLCEDVLRVARARGG